MAEAIAGEFLACNRMAGICREDVMQDAQVAMLCAIESYQPECGIAIEAHISRRVRDGMVKMFGKRKRRGEIARMVSIDAPDPSDESILGYEDGDPLYSLRDLRSALSLNPPAALSPGMLEAIGDVRQAAVSQCCEQHPKHKAYVASCGISRTRTKKISTGFEALSRRKSDALRHAQSAA